MCSHYQAAKKRERIEQFHRRRGLPLPDGWEGGDIWPRRDGLYLQRPPEWESGDEAVPEVEGVLGRWGLVSAQTQADYLPRAEKLSTFNARSETAANSRTFKHAWHAGQRCIIPAEAIFEPDWRSGKSVATRFTRADGEPLGVAGLWDRYRDAAGQWRESYTMLTINADQHPLFKLYHRPGKEKRMVVILPDDSYEAWLTAAPERTTEFLRPFPADRLQAEPT